MTTNELKQQILLKIEQDYLLLSRAIEFGEVSGYRTIEDLRKLVKIQKEKLNKFIQDNDK